MWRQATWKILSKGTLDKSRCHSYFSTKRWNSHHHFTIAYKKWDSKDFKNIKLQVSSTSNLDKQWFISFIQSRFYTQQQSCLTSITKQTNPYRNEIGQLRLKKLREIERENYSFIEGFDGMRSDEIALHALESKSKGIILDPSDFMGNSLRRLHFFFLPSLKKTSSASCDRGLPLPTEDW